MNADSVKARLKNKSKSTGKTLQELLTIYALERTIYRLSLSKYKKNFTLKGGIFLYAVFDGDFARATTDIDFLAQGVSNEILDMKKVFMEIFSIMTNDPLVYDVDTMQVKPITEFKKYHGVNVTVKAYLDRTEITVSVDIGFGDAVYPERAEVDFPTVLSDEPPRVFAYSLCSAIAEKFEAIVSLGEDNTRFKDYYDIYVLSETHDFDGMDMAGAIRETFEHRNTSLLEIVVFEPGFSEDELRVSRWKSFIKKKKAMMTITLPEAIASIKEFLEPIRLSLLRHEEFAGKWFHEEHRWV